MLDDLAAGGITAVSADELGRIAKSCWDRCATTGDGRYCILAEAFARLDSWLSEHEERGGTPTILFNQVDTAIRTMLPAVIEQQEAGVGAQLAEELRQEIGRRLLPPNRWTGLY